ncbi:MAG: hypothetical protein ACLFWD_02770, partial [Anaerolineales bacterium]
GQARGYLVNGTSEVVLVQASAGEIVLEETPEILFRGVDLSLSKAAPAKAVPGFRFEYTLTAKNLGLVAAENVVLTDILPEGINFISQNSPISPNEDGQTLSWQLGTIAAGEQTSIVLVVEVPAGHPIDVDLNNRASITSDSSDDNPADNQAQTTTQVVRGYIFNGSLEPANPSVSIGGNLISKIKLRNTGILTDRYSISVNGLDPDWYELEGDTLALAPGASSAVDLKLGPQACQLAASYPFTVEVTSLGDDSSQSLAGNLTLTEGVKIFGRQPKAGATLGAREVVFSWRTDVPASGLLTVQPAGQPGEAIQVSTPEDTAHSVLVPDLERNTSYEWTIEATSNCGSTISDPHTFTIGNGIVFVRRSQFTSIDRDYNQQIGILVRNDDNQPRDLLLEVEHPYEDLIINFIGSGSVDETVTLQPGESRSVPLVVHSQDAEQRNYTITAELTADEGTSDPITDLATISVEVLAEGDYVIEEIEAPSQTGARTYRVTNRGRPITDMTIDAIDPATGEHARAYLSPGVTHARLDTDQSLEFRVIPLYGPEDVEAEPVASVQAVPGLASMAPSVAIPYELEASGGGVEQTYPDTLSCPTGNQVFPVTLPNVYMPFRSSSWYCTNRPDITLPFTLPPFINTGRISSVDLGAAFSPRTDVRPHTTSIDMNGAPIATLANTIPRGSYSWDVLPASLNTGTRGPVRQDVGIVSAHPNGGHYVVATGFQLGIVFEEVTIYVCGSSQEEAELLVSEMYDFHPLPSEVSVQITKPLSSSEASFNENGQVLLQAFVQDDQEEYFNYYDVTGTIEYQDSFPTPDEEISLFDDGFKSTNGDPTANDRAFSALWQPAASGRVRMTVEAAAPNGLVASDSVLFDVQALPDFALVSLYQDQRALRADNVRVVAHIENLGSPVAGPVIVEFRYFRLNLDTGEPIGEAIHVSQQVIFDGEVFETNARAVIADESFETPELVPYFVEVVVDP